MLTRQPKHVYAAVALAAAAFVALFAVAAPPRAHAASRPTASLTHVAATPNGILPPDWVDWDGNKITSAAKCESRRRAVSQAYRIPLYGLRCLYVSACPPYWVLQVDNNIAIAPDIVDLGNVGRSLVRTA